MLAVWCRSGANVGGADTLLPAPQDAFVSRSLDTDSHDVDQCEGQILVPQGEASCEEMLLQEEDEWTVVERKDRAGCVASMSTRSSTQAMPGLPVVSSTSSTDTRGKDGLTKKQRENKRRAEKKRAQRVAVELAMKGKLGAAAH